MASSQHQQRTSCPCKLVRLSLSSFTAAEYGDVCALAKLGSSVLDRRPEDGITPLHLAAQHGHVAVTYYLLQQGCNVDGGGDSDELYNDDVATIMAGDSGSNMKRSFCTPLHRASFSGAVGTMKLLIEHNQPTTTTTTIGRQSQRLTANLFARDTSFGDERTPLHKAAAGGRYLAVQLLLDTLTERGMLVKGLQIRDRYGETPLDVALEKLKNETEERQSVARWDATAGYPSNWGKCVKLLQAAEASITKTSVNEKMKENIHNQTPSSTTETSRLMKNDEQNPIIFNESELNRMYNTSSCVDCQKCVTATWENAFLMALNTSVGKTLGEKDQESHNKHEEQPYEEHMEDEDEDKQQVQEEEVTKYHQQQDGTTYISSNIPAQTKDANFSPISKNATTTAVGYNCKVCGNKTIAVFLAKNGQLVCKGCKRYN